MDILYRRAFRPILFRMDAESAWKRTLAFLTFIEHVPYLVSSQPRESRQLSINRWGIRFSSPIGLGAGVDKNALAALCWQKFGFAFAELGTVTPQPQLGNPQPRMWRLPNQNALVNSIGFSSKGCASMERRVHLYRRRGIRMKLALNLGPNKDSTSSAQIVRDYAALFEKLSPIADFIVINVSSPNTPGLRNWQAPERMISIINVLRSAQIAGGRQPPILIKLAPDSNTGTLQEICAAVVEHGIDGIIATNTTIQRESIGVECIYPGGISGQPLKELARNTIRRVYEFTRGQVPIIGVGGVASAEDAYGHIRAGASLVEFCTGLIYNGPGLPSAIKAGLIRLLNRDGFRSIDEAVGTENQRIGNRRSEVARVA